MSERIYNYLAKKVIQYFKDNAIKPGDKFYIQFEKEEEVRDLYDCLKQSIEAKEFEYEDTEHREKFRSFVLTSGSVDLLIAASIDGIHPDYLTLIRNFVGIKSEFKNMGVLFIHNSILDSILGGTGSFHKAGMPFHFKSIEDDINAEIAKSDLSTLDKKILETTLEDKREAYLGESVSVFAYKDILNVINTTGIKQEQYKDFGLFPDPDAINKSDKEIKERLEKNRKNFTLVADAHNSGTIELTLDKYYDERGVKKLSEETWESVTYSDIETFINDKKKGDVLDYKECIGAWDRAQGTTKAQSRIRNIIVFQKEDGSDNHIEFSFTDFLQKEYLENLKDDTISISCSGKKIQVDISWHEKGTKFYFFKYNHKNKTKFQFNIVVLSCSEKYFSNIKSKYSVVKIKKSIPEHILINTNEAEILFNGESKCIQEVDIAEENQKVVLTEEGLRLRVSEDYEYSDESELVRFELNVEGIDIPFAVIGSGQKTTIIESLRLWKQKRDRKTDFVIIGENKLQQGTNEYCTREEFRKILDLEKSYIDLEQMGAKESQEKLFSLDLSVSDELKASFSAIIHYFKARKSLPTLAYLNDDLKKLYQNYLNAYMKEVNEIKDGDYLTKQQKDLFYVGMIVRTSGDKEILLTPLHPLNVAYQLSIADEDTTTISNEEKDLLLKLQARNLLPYITMEPISERNAVYVPVQQNVFPEWNTYIDIELPRYKGTKDYVSKLVCDKIKEFVEHFSYLFDIGVNAPIRINLINTGDSKEILQGILKYYLKEFREKNSKFIQPMEINIYGNDKTINAFDEFASIDDCDELKEIFHLDLEVEDMKEEEVIDLYREKVQFYKKDMEQVAYAHITFMEMIEENKITYAAMNDIPTGITMNGKTSSVPSKLIGESYRTGFGLKYANKDNDLVKLAARLNAMNVAMDGSEFSEGKCCTYTISKQSKERLDKIYDASHWVTFINPMVDLNFFKNDNESSDLLIIHYSDQYNTTSSGYDAITVTRKSKQYTDVIIEYLKKFSMDNVSERAVQIINMFNAVNGDWLLRLLSRKSHFPKEKISILSAVKLALARFKMDDVIWVPVSLEEILRISRGIGLKQSSGLFSAKNLGFENGSASDDLLLIGIKQVNENLLVTFYPIEVKIGENQKDYLQKGIRQAKATKKLFRDTIIGGTNNLQQEFYRNFFMQLAISSAEKFLLYGVGDGTQGWERLTDTDIRRKLLNGEFEVVDTLEPDMRESAVFSFKRNGISSEIYNDNVLIVERSERDGIEYISKPISCIEKISWDAVESVIDLEEYRQSQMNSVKSNETIATVECGEECDGVFREKDDPRELLAAVAEEKGFSEADKVEEKRYMQVLFGNKKSNNEEVIWHPNDSRRLTHTNTGIIGTMGTGKTQFTKSLITQLYRESKYNVEGKELGILIFDYKGDYNCSKADFVKATNAKVYSLCDLPYNPLALFVTEHPKPMLPMHTANSLKDTLSKAFGLGVKQETLLRNLIMEAYERKGIDKKDSSTWTKQPPTLNDVYNIYINKEDFKEDSLYAAFSNLIDFEIFEPDASKTESLYDLVQGVTVIDLSGFDPSIQNLVVAITLDLFYSQMHANGSSKLEGEDARQLNKMILVDEADNFLSMNFPSLRKILKEGREFGVGTILSTQLLSHFSTGDNEYADYILTWVVHNVSDLSNKEIRYIFNTQNKGQEDELYNKIKSLQKHESIVKIGNSNNPIWIRDKAFWELVKE